ncbi:7-cyano-7-deazaguanine synthase [Candidatus Woesearchaeota archaeon]|nr:7-cyano-7-deazaguanine synthase [Candidatus Woesearchaeota archaeon]
MHNMHKVLLLLSGGIDSAVAARLLMDQGCEIIALHFSLEPFTDDTAKQKSIAIARSLGIRRLLSIVCGLQHARIVERCTHRYYYVITRRMMLRIAEQIARNEGCGFIATGDNLGQVGSQTLANMQVISHAVSMEILRPLLANDKLETIALAKKYGTYELSIGPEMCSVLGPKHPATSSRLEVIEHEEARIDMRSLIDEQLAATEIISL